MEQTRSPTQYWWDSRIEFQVLGIQYHHISVADIFFSRCNSLEDIPRQFESNKKCKRFISHNNDFFCVTDAKAWYCWKHTQPWLMKICPTSYHHFWTSTAKSPVIRTIRCSICPWLKTGIIQTSIAMLSKVKYILLVVYTNKGMGRVIHHFESIREQTRQIILLF